MSARSGTQSTSTVNPAAGAVSLRAIRLVDMGGGTYKLAGTGTEAGSIVDNGDGTATVTSTTLAGTKRLFGIGSNLLLSTQGGP